MIKKFNEWLNKPITSEDKFIAIVIAIGIFILYTLL